MKSVIQEGSSLAKAIEQGWVKAGKPKEFTIKIFQEAKKNFFGFTTVAAKVGIFFKEAGGDSKDSKIDKRPAQRPQRPNHNQQQQPYRQQNHHQKRKFYPNNEEKRDTRGGMQNRPDRPVQRDEYKKNPNLNNTASNKPEDKE